MSEANSIPVPSNPIGRYPGHAPAAAAKSKLLDRFHEAPRSRRRSFAIHQLEGGYEIRLVQEILGHESAKATMLHTHVLNRGEEGFEAPWMRSEFRRMHGSYTETIYSMVTSHAYGPGKNERDC